MNISLLQRPAFFAVPLLSLLMAFGAQGAAPSGTSSTEETGTPAASAAAPAADDSDWQDQAPQRAHRLRRSHRQDSPWNRLCELPRCPRAPCVHDRLLPCVSGHGLTPSVLLVVPVTVGVVTGAATPMILVTVLLPLLVTHTDPALSMIRPVGVLSSPVSLW